jgi:hypothetical protein
MDDQDGLGTGGRMVLAATVSAVVVAALVILVGGPLVERRVVGPAEQPVPLVLTAG